MLQRSGCRVVNLMVRKIQRGFSYYRGLRSHPVGAFLPLEVTSSIQHIAFTFLIFDFAFSFYFVFYFHNSS